MEPVDTEGILFLTCIFKTHASSTRAPCVRDHIGRLEAELLEMRLASDAELVLKQFRQRAGMSCVS